MLYKTIILELLQQQPQLHDQLRKNGKLLPTMARHATELKASHEAWKERLLLARPGSEPSQIESEALELALQQLRDYLDSASDQNDRGSLSLDAAMAFIRPTSPA